MAFSRGNPFSARNVFPSMPLTPRMSSPCAVPSAGELPSTAITAGSEAYFSPSVLPIGAYLNHASWLVSASSGYAYATPDSTPAQSSRRNVIVFIAVRREVDGELTYAFARQAFRADNIFVENVGQQNSGPFFEYHNTVKKNRNDLYVYVNGGGIVPHEI